MKRNSLFLFVAFFCLGLSASVFAGCGADLTSTVSVEQSDVVKYLWIKSLYPYSITTGSNFQAIFQGTNQSAAYTVVSGENVTLMIGYEKPAVPIGNSPSSDSPAGTPSIPSSPSTPSKSPSSVSSSSSLTISFVQLAISLFGILSLRWSTKSAAAILMVAIALASMNVIETADDLPCPNVQVTLQIPSGQANYICDANNGTCVCGADYTGPNCNFYKPTCQPTSQQLANRMDTSTAFAPEEMSLPDPGASWCDSNFGTQVWRVTNREALPSYLDSFNFPAAKLADQRIQSGTLGFSPGNKYLATYSGINNMMMYEINIDQYNIPRINTTKRILAGPLYYDDVYIGFVPLTTSVWMTPNIIVFARPDFSVYALDISLEPTADGTRIPIKIGDLSAALQYNYYASDTISLSSCTSSSRRADGSVLMMCDIWVSPSSLPTPKVDHIDSHPNVTCVSAKYERSSIGYVIFKIKSATPTNADTNIEIITKFVNGVDSDEWYCFQTVTQWSSGRNDYRKWYLYTLKNNGYSVSLDRSGEWFQAYTINDTSISDTLFAATIKYRVGGGVERSRVSEQTSSLGWGTAVSQSYSSVCQNCIAYWDYTTLSDDDPDRVNPTSLIGYKLGDWGYNIVGKSSYFHATEGTRRESLVEFGCNVYEYNCTAIPRGNEAARVVADNDGGGIIERLVSTRDGSYYAFSIVSSECTDDGPCWGAFQSTWGVPRALGNAVTNSDIFIFRFR